MAGFADRPSFHKKNDPSKERRQPPVRQKLRGPPHRHLRSQRFHHRNSFDQKLPNAVFSSNINGVRKVPSTAAVRSHPFSQQQPERREPSENEVWQPPATPAHRISLQFAPPA